MADDSFSLYAHDPSPAAAMIFLLAFGVISLWHVWVIIRQRAWYFTPLFIGCILETVGYVGRFLTPALLAASIYMVFGRLILFLRASTISPIKPTRMTKIFVAGDIISFLVQCMGGGLIARQESFNLGKTVILIGLVIQIVFFGLFILAAVVFHVRIMKRPPPSVQAEMGTKWFKGWRGVILVLYVSSGLIFVRSIFRLIEYTGDRDGPLMSQEAYLYVFDSTLMLGAVGIVAMLHPANYVPTKKEIMMLQDVEIET
ncbi:hypothetical protein AK830_g2442 [Neonectria ditissima]|uniref:Protein RTA1 n=1 Tax=Neonectria ditissima TaxID=78410 RepID=A0A0P7BK58_9HYPO|nr:hypothetical protein AK830_g2442 [Neonectria ditissima]